MLGGKSLPVCNTRNDCLYICKNDYTYTELSKILHKIILAFYIYKLSRSSTKNTLFLD